MNRRRPAGSVLEMAVRNDAARAAIEAGPATTESPAHRELDVGPYPLDLPATVGGLARGRWDCSTRVSSTDLWWATNTPEGPATLHLWLGQGGADAAADAWGRGATWVLDQLPDLLGVSDDLAGFERLLSGLDGPAARSRARAAPPAPGTAHVAVRSRRRGPRAQHLRAEGGRGRRPGQLPPTGAEVRFTGTGPRRVRSRRPADSGPAG